MQVNDNGKTTVRCGRILKLKVLVYVDDVTLIGRTAGELCILSKITNNTSIAIDDADIEISMPKTFSFSHHVNKRKKTSVTGQN